MQLPNTTFTIGFNFKLVHSSGLAYPMRVYVTQSYKWNDCRGLHQVIPPSLLSVFCAPELQVRNRWKIVSYPLLWSLFSFSIPGSHLWNCIRSISRRLEGEHILRSGIPRPRQEYCPFLDCCSRIFRGRQSTSIEVCYFLWATAVVGIQRSSTTIHDTGTSLEANWSSFFV